MPERQFCYGVERSVLKTTLTHHMLRFVQQTDRLLLPGLARNPPETPAFAGVTMMDRGVGEGGGAYAVETGNFLILTPRCGWFRFPRGRGAPPGG